MNRHHKTLLGAMFSISLIAVPFTTAHAATRDHQVAATQGNHFQQLAQEEEDNRTVREKADSKMDEMHDMGTGAAHEVNKVHREHEMNEVKHRDEGLGAKAEGKMDELHDQATGAAGAVEQRHEEHEQEERSRSTTTY